MMSLMMMHGVNAVIVGAMLERIRVTYELDTDTAGSIEFLRVVLGVAMMIGSVKLLSLFRAKWMFVFSRLAIAAGYLISASTLNFKWFMFGAALMGMGNGVVDSLFAQTVSNLHRGKSNIEKFFLIIQSFFSIATIVTPLVIGYCLQKEMSWQTVMLLVAVPSVVVAVVMAVSDLPEITPSEGNYLTNTKFVFSSVQGWLFSIVLFVASWLEALFYNWGPSFVKENFGDNPQLTTASITIYGLCAFSARMIAAFIPSKRTVYFIKTFSCYSLIAACFTLYCFSGIYAFYVTAGLVGFAAGPLWPSTSGLVTDHVPAANVSYYLVIGLVGFAGYALAPLVTGVLAKQTGNINTGFFVFIPLMAITLMFAVSKLRSLAKENGSYYR